MIILKCNVASLTSIPTSSLRPGPLCPAHLALPFSLLTRLSLSPSSPGSPFLPPHLALPFFLLTWLSLSPSSPGSPFLPPHKALPFSLLTWLSLSPSSPFFLLTPSLTPLTPLTPFPFSCSGHSVNPSPYLAVPGSVLPTCHLIGMALGAADWLPWGRGHVTLHAPVEIMKCYHSSHSQLGQSPLLLTKLSEDQRIAAFTSHLHINFCVYWPFPGNHKRC